MQQGSTLLFSVVGTDPDSNQFSTLRLIVSATEGPVFFSNSLVISGNEISPATSLNAPSKLATFDLEFRPPANLFGIARVSYFFRDDYGLQSGIDTVYINIVHVNHQPTTASFELSTLENVPGNDLVATRIHNEWLFSDFDGSYDSYSLVITAMPSRGTLLDENSDPLLQDTPIAAGSNSEWTIFFIPVVSTYEDSGAYTTFQFQICDNSMAAGTNCSLVETVTVNVHPVNHAPSSNSFNVTLAQNSDSQISFPASDPDAWDPDQALALIILSSTGPGSFYTDSTFTNPMTPSNVIATRNVWYKPPTNVASPAPTVALASLSFQVLDGNTSFSDVFTVSIFVTPILQPPSYKANLHLEVSQNIPANFLLASPSLFDNWNVGFNGEYSTAISVLPSRGSLAVCDQQDVCTYISKSGQFIAPAKRAAEAFRYPVGSSLGHVVFLADENTFGANYATLSYVVTDNLNQSASVTVTFDVEHINQKPKFLDVSWADSSVALNENGTALVKFRVGDVDSLPANITLRLTSRATSRYDWTLSRCVDNTTQSPCDVSGVIASDVAPAKNLNPVATFIQNTTCDHAPGFPVTDFSGCGLYFVFQFTPEKRRYSYQYVQFVLTAEDSEGQESDQQVVYVAVLPVNDPPTISAPSRYVGVTGAKEIPLTDTSSGVTFVVDDFDATRASELLLDVLHVSGMTGAFTTSSTATGNCQRNMTAANEGKLAWSCLGTLAALNKMLQHASWTFNDDGSASSDLSTLQFTINDQGSTSVDNLDFKSASQTVVFEYSRATAVVTVPATSNLLTIISFIVAFLALLIIALIVWRIRRKFKAPENDYFAAGAASIATGNQNPLFKQLTIEYTSPLYKGEEMVPKTARKNRSAPDEFVSESSDESSISQDASNEYSSS